MTIRLFHFLYDGAMYLNFYLYEKNKREQYNESSYNIIWCTLLTNIGFTIGLLGFINARITGNSHPNIMVLIFLLMLPSLLYVHFQVKRLKRLRFVEQDLDNYNKLSNEEKKKLAMRGLFYRLIPIALYPIIVLILTSIIGDFI